MSHTNINEVIKLLDDILLNNKNNTLVEIGGYIVGSIAFRDDTDELFGYYPNLNQISIYAEELEMIENDDKLAGELFENIKNELSLLKNEKSRKTLN